MGIQRDACPARRSMGFTLIESAVVLVVASVLLCMALPALGRMLARHRLVAAQLDLVAALQHARGLAITSGRRTLLCPSADGLQCTDDTHWEHGWVSGNYRSDKASQLDGPPERVNAGYTQLVIISTVGRTRIRFQPHGAPGSGNVTFTLCRPGHAEEALAITVSTHGRVAGTKPRPDDATRCAAGS